MRTAAKRAIVAGALVGFFGASGALVLTLGSNTWLVQSIRPGCVVNYVGHEMNTEFRGPQSNTYCRSHATSLGDSSAQLGQPYLETISKPSGTLMCRIDYEKVVATVRDQRDSPQLSASALCNELGQQLGILYGGHD